jgi:diguanylate cyclase (GGDEF)-like protein
VRVAVAERPLPEVGRVTVSLGVAACPSNALTERELFSASDAALYHAKRSGRNQTSLAGSYAQAFAPAASDVS